MENTVTLSFEELSPELKEDAVLNYSEDIFIPDNWFDDILDSFVEDMQKQHFEIEASDIEWDNYFNLRINNGYLNLANFAVELNKYFDSLSSHDLLTAYDLTLYGDGSEFNEDLELEYSTLRYIIESTFEETTQNDNTILIEISDNLNTSLSSIEDLEIFEKDDPLNDFLSKINWKEHDFIATLDNSISSASLFFQNEISLENGDVIFEEFLDFMTEQFDELITPLLNEILSRAEDILSTEHSKLSETLRTTYESFFEFDSIAENIIANGYEFLVLLDENGNQQSIQEFNIYE